MDQLHAHQQTMHHQAPASDLGLARRLSHARAEEITDRRQLVGNTSGRDARGWATAPSAAHGPMLGAGAFGDDDNDDDMFPHSGRPDDSDSGGSTINGGDDEDESWPSLSYGGWQDDVAGVSHTWSNKCASQAPGGGQGGSDDEGGRGFRLDLGEAAGGDPRQGRGGSTVSAAPQQQALPPAAQQYTTLFDKVQHHPSQSMMVQLVNMPPSSSGSSLSSADQPFLGDRPDVMTHQHQHQHSLNHHAQVRPRFHQTAETGSARTEAVNEGQRSEPLDVARRPHQQTGVHQQPPQQQLQPRQQAQHMGRTVSTKQSPPQLDLPVRF